MKLLRQNGFFLVRLCQKSSTERRYASGFFLAWLEKFSSWAKLPLNHPLPEN